MHRVRPTAVIIPARGMAAHLSRLLVFIDITVAQRGQDRRARCDVWEGRDPGEHGAPQSLVASNEINHCGIGGLTGRAKVGVLEGGSHKVAL